MITSWQKKVQFMMLKMEYKKWLYSNRYYNILPLVLRVITWHKRATVSLYRNIIIPQHTESLGKQITADGVTGTRTRHGRPKGTETCNAWIQLKIEDIAVTRMLTAASHCTRRHWYSSRQYHMSDTGRVEKNANMNTSRIWKLRNQHKTWNSVYTSITISVS